MRDELRQQKQKQQSDAGRGIPGSKAADPSRPKTVVYAVCSASGAIALGVVGTMVGLAGSLPTSPARTLPTYPLAVVILSLGAIGLWGLEAYWIYGTWLGRNRSRVLYIGFTLVTMILMLTNAGVTEALAEQPLRAGQFIITICLELAAVALLVLPISNAWFREVRAANASSAQSVTQSTKQRPRKRKP